jgi:hypothetical protein
MPQRHGGYCRRGEVTIPSNQSAPSILLTLMPGDRPTAGSPTPPPLDHLVEQHAEGGKMAIKKRSITKQVTPKR